MEEDGAGDPEGQRWVDRDAEVAFQDRRQLRYEQSGRRVERDADTQFVGADEDDSAEGQLHGAIGPSLPGRRNVQPVPYTYQSSSSTPPGVDRRVSARPRKYSAKTTPAINPAAVAATKSHIRDSCAAVSTVSLTGGGVG